MPRKIKDRKCVMILDIEPETAKKFEQLKKQTQKSYDELIKQLIKNFEEQE